MLRRIAVVGSSGSGKSTLAAELGRVLDIPVTHLDVLFWKPGWVESEPDDFDARVLERIQDESWVIDGNYSRTLGPRLALADMIVFLDFHRVRCLYRAFKRRVQYRDKTRPDMAPGCPEKIDLDFALWIWNYPGRSRSKTIALIKEHGSNKEIRRLRNPDDVDRFLDQMRHRASLQLQAA